MGLLHRKYDHRDEHLYREAGLPSPSPHRSLATKFSVFTVALLFWVTMIILTIDSELHSNGPLSRWLLAMIVIAAAAAVAWLTIRQFIRPLGLLQQGLNMVGQGRLELLRISSTSDEVEALGKSFNRMITALEASRVEIQRHQDLLEERICQRTEELEEATRQALSASQAKGEFLANMSHELRTPMTGVLGMIDIVLDSRLTEEQREQLETSQRCAHSLLALLNDLLDLSKIEAGKMILERIPLDVRLLVVDCLQGQAPRARQKGIRLSYEISPEVPTCLIGDPLRLRQILNNLLSNAVKFTDAGSVCAHLTGAPSTPSGKFDLHLEVTDTGAGIPAEKLPLVFEKFTQADGSISRRYGGTGLGLAITNKLVETHGGEIWVESEVGRGSKFHVMIPMEQGNSDVVAEEIPAPAAGQAPPACNAADSCVLVVEDNPVNRTVITSLLEKRGFRVRTANDGRQAIEILEAAPVDLVLMDVQMPVMDGLETTRLIRAEPRWRKLPIVAMTAHAMDGDRTQCLDAGMDDYVAKPIQPAHLMATLGKFLARRPAARQEAQPGPAAVLGAPHSLTARLLDKDRSLGEGMSVLFLQLAPSRIEKLHNAAAEDNTGALAAEAQLLSGAAERIAAADVAECAAQIREAAVAKDIKAARNGLSRLDEAIRRFHARATAANTS
jgi:signal transduction histidine kinase/CheY-like chemotaxis protein